MQCLKHQNNKLNSRTQPIPRLRVAPTNYTVGTEIRKERKSMEWLLVRYGAGYYVFMYYLIFTNVLLVRIAFMLISHFPDPRCLIVF